MLTKNFWKIFTALVGRVQGETKEVTVTLPSGSSYTNNIYGTNAKPYSVLGAICAPWCNEKIGTWFGVWYGTGTTLPTLDDYKMEAPITDGSLSTKAGSAALVASVEADCVRISVPHSVTNLTSQDITISEIGCLGQIESGNSFLLDHTVLETPIVVPAGKTIALEYVIKFPYGS